FWAAGEQREFQNQIAGALRAVRAGQPEAVMLLLSVCFAYGFFHAVGPGHGKVLVGGYGLGRRVPVWRLAGIGLAASLGQAVTAVALVYAGVAVLNLGRQQLVGVTERVMAPASYAAIALVGCWLVWRGARRLAASRAGTADHAQHHHDDHHHSDGHGEVCSDCGHRHGPSIDEVEQAGTLREALLLIGSIAARPCTGAIFVLILTWQMGIALTGIAGAFAMALGTGAVTVGVGLMSAGMRGGLAGAASAWRVAGVALPMIELSAGLVVAAIAGGLFLRAV
ncbi:nickel/cobalt transporter, partial [Cribrihabitans sp. XS_ASV171]